MDQMKIERLHTIRHEREKKLSKDVIEKMLGIAVKKTKNTTPKGFTQFNMYDSETGELILEEIEEWDIKMFFELIGLDIFEILNNS